MKADEICAQELRLAALTIEQLPFRVWICPLCVKSLRTMKGRRLYRISRLLRASERFSIEALFEI